MAASVALLDGPVSHVEGGGVFPLGLMVYLRHVTVKTGTSPLGPHQGRKTTVAHFSSLSPFTTQPPPDADPATLSQSPRGARGRGLPEECVCACAGLQGVAGRLPARGVLTVGVAFRAAREPILSPLGDGTPFSTLPILGPPMFLVSGHTSPCPWWWPL